VLFFSQAFIFECSIDSFLLHKEMLLTYYFSNAIIYFLSSFNSHIYIGNFLILSNKLIVSDSSIAYGKRISRQA